MAFSSAQAPDIKKEEEIEVLDLTEDGDDQVDGVNTCESTVLCPRIDECNLVELQPQQVAKLNYPVGCPVFYKDQDNCSSNSGRKQNILHRGTVKSIYLDIKFKKFVYTLEPQEKRIGAKEEAITPVKYVLEDRIFYATNCPVFVQSKYSVSGCSHEMEGEILYRTPLEYDNRTEEITYAVVLFMGKNKLQIEQGVDPDRLKYRELTAKQKRDIVESKKQPEIVVETANDHGNPNSDGNVEQGVQTGLPTKQSNEPYTGTEQKPKYSQGGSKSVPINSTLSKERPPCELCGEIEQVPSSLTSESSSKDTFIQHKMIKWRPPSGNSTHKRPLTYDNSYNPDVNTFDNPPKKMARSSHSEINYDSEGTKSFVLRLFLPLWLTSGTISFPGAALRERCIRFSSEHDCTIQISDKRNRKSDVSIKLVSNYLQKDKAYKNVAYNMVKKGKEMIEDFFLSELGRDASKGRLLYELAATSDGSFHVMRSERGSVRQRNHNKSGLVRMNLLELPFAKTKTTVEFHDQFLLNNNQLRDYLNEVNCSFDVVKEGPITSLSYCEPYILICGKSAEQLDEATRAVKEAILCHQKYCVCGPKV